MKRLLILTALLPFVGFAQPINTLNNPNQPGYQIPSQHVYQNYGYNSISAVSLM